MTDFDEVLEMIKREYDEIEATGAKAMRMVSRRIYPVLPLEYKTMLNLFDYLISTGDWGVFWLVTDWIKKEDLYQLKNFSLYEKWMLNQVDNWGVCDVFCYRVINPMFEKHPQIYENLLNWADSPKTYVRRAAAVSLLQSSSSFQVNCSFDKVYTIVEKLKDDCEVHVQKGVGWLLKYTYLAYPDEVYNYLKENVDNLSRTIFRYALEKAPEEIREELMEL